MIFVRQELKLHRFIFFGYAYGIGEMSVKWDEWLLKTGHVLNAKLISPRMHRRPNTLATELYTTNLYHRDRLINEYAVTVRPRHLRRTILQQWKKHETGTKKEEARARQREKRRQPQWKFELRVTIHVTHRRHHGRKDPTSKRLISDHWQHPRDDIRRLAGRAAHLRRSTSVVCHGNATGPNEASI